MANQGSVRVGLKAGGQRSLKDLLMMPHLPQHNGASSPEQDLPGARRLRVRRGSFIEAPVDPSFSCKELHGPEVKEVAVNNQQRWIMVIYTGGTIGMQLHDGGKRSW